MIGNRQQQRWLATGNNRTKHRQLLIPLNNNLSKPLWLELALSSGRIWTKNGLPMELFNDLAIFVACCLQSAWYISADEFPGFFEDTQTVQG
jgi:hypothetical protein